MPTTKLFLLGNVESKEGCICGLWRLCWAISWPWYDLCIAIRQYWWLLKCKRIFDYSLCRLMSAPMLWLLGRLQLNEGCICVYRRLYCAIKLSQGDLCKRTWQLDGHWYVLVILECHQLFRLMPTTQLWLLRRLESSEGRMCDRWRFFFAIKWSWDNVLSGIQ